MLSMDIFNSDAFGVIEMTESVNMVPIAWGRLGELGLFVPKPLRTDQFMIESRNGVLVLIQSSTPGTDLPGARRKKPQMRNFNTSRFGQSDHITAKDIAGIRAFGTSSELMQVEDIVAGVQDTIRGNIDITLEYLRSGALKGQILDADGSVLVDLFSEFGVSQKVVDFKLGSATGAAAACDEVRRHIRLNMKGDVLTEVRCLASPGFWDKLMANAEFKEAHKYYNNGQQPLREDVSGGVKWNNIWWEEYLAEGDVPQEDGTTVTQSFIPDGDARFFPMGTRKTFSQYNSPADYLDVANTLGEPFYSSVALDPKHARYAEVEAQTVTLPMCNRPGVLVRGHTST